MERVCYLEHLQTALIQVQRAIIEHKIGNLEVELFYTTTSSDGVSEVLLRLTSHEQPAAGIFYVSLFAVVQFSKLEATCSNCPSEKGVG